MQRTEQKLTDKEKIQVFDELIDLIISTFDNSIRPGFEKVSRYGQLGYDTVWLLRNRDIIAPGKRERQLKLEIKTPEDGEKQKDLRAEEERNELPEAGRDV